MYGLYALESLSVPSDGAASIKFLDAEDTDRAVQVLMTTKNDVARVSQGIRDQLANGIANIDAAVTSVTGRVIDSGDGRPMIHTEIDGHGRVIALDLDRIPGAENFDFHDGLEVTATGAIAGRVMQPFSLMLREPAPENDRSLDI